MLTDGPKKALTTEVAAGEFGIAGASSQVSDNAEVKSVVTWKPDQVFKKSDRGGEIPKGSSPLRFVWHSLWLLYGPGEYTRCMGPGRTFPPLYPILDATFLSPPEDGRDDLLGQLVLRLAEAGVEILQYRNKQGSETEILHDAQIMRAKKNRNLKLILNDFPYLAEKANCDGVHVGQDDIAPGQARVILSSDRIVGVSTHNETQLRAADLQPVDYIAVGPIFATSSKQNPDPVVGLDGIRLARRLTKKPIVAIGGITLQNAPLVWDAGADSIAVISAVFAPGLDPAQMAEAFLRIAPVGQSKASG
jgi:thiamine-phosphate pyrophosphorylase